MMTLRDYYDSDFRSFLTQHHKYNVTYGDGSEGALTMDMRYDVAAHARFMTCYVEEETQLSVLSQILSGLSELLSDKPLQILASAPGDSKSVDLTDATFTKRLYVYHPFEAPSDKRASIETATGQEVDIIWRGTEYEALRNQYSRPRAFICHDTRDKDEIARPLAHRLISTGCPVWYDEYSLRVGDRLRQTIDRGLNVVEKCIMVVTPNLLENRGWTADEFDTIFLREQAEKKDLLLPIWHNVSQEQVRKYSGPLANRFALNWAKGLQTVAHQLKQAIDA